MKIGFGDMKKSEKTQKTDSETISTMTDNYIEPVDWDTIDF